MKRKGNLYEKLISDENLRRALMEVNATHRWHHGHRMNRTVARVEADMEGSVKRLREVIETGYDAAEPRITRRWDKSAGKWRDISEPRLWSDQYVHHAVIQVLEPVFMRGMDRFCCGSIKGRGIHYGMKFIKKWMKEDEKGTRYAMELDIRHFYDSLTKETVMKRLRQLIKDRRMLDVCERLMKYGVLIGAYFSQWFANTVLQPLDMRIRKSGLCAHYLRYMDNFTIFSANKRKLRRLKSVIELWLHGMGLELKGNWQIYPTKHRNVTALGYKFGRGYTLLRKRNLIRLKRKLRECLKLLRRHRKVPHRMAEGLISRLGQMKHCRHVRFYERYVPRGTQRALKSIVRERTRKEKARWNTYTERQTSAALCMRT